MKIYYHLEIFYILITIKILVTYQNILYLNEILWFEAKKVNFFKYIYKWFVKV